MGLRKIRLRQVHVFQVALLQERAPEYGLHEPGLAQGQAVEDRPGEIGGREVGAVDRGVREDRVAQIGMDQPRVGERGVIEIGARQAGVRGIGPGKDGIAEVGRRGVDGRQDGHAEIGPQGLDLDQRAKIQHGMREICFRGHCPIQDGLGEVAVAQVAVRDPCPRKVDGLPMRPIQVGRREQRQPAAAREQSAAVRDPALDRGMQDTGRHGMAGAAAFGDPAGQVFNGRGRRDRGYCFDQVAGQVLFQRAIA